jgi:hypothetical protein
MDFTHVPGPDPDPDPDPMSLMPYARAGVFLHPPVQLGPAADTNVPRNVCQTRSFLSPETLHATLSDLRS